MKAYALVVTKADILGGIEDDAVVEVAVFDQKWGALDTLRKRLAELMPHCVYAKFSDENMTAKVCEDMTVFCLAVREIEPGCAAREVKP